MSDAIRLVERFPGVADYVRMRALTGLSPKSEEAARRSLGNTTFGVSLLRGEEVVGMGRIIGDGACFHFVVDIAVDPALQGQGLGKRIMGALDAWLRVNALPTAHVSLFADGDAKHLYEKYGFAQSEKSVGMFYRVSPR
ncbi:GNAT family N-acetyltransferase [Thermomonas sp. HDW16]|uniref:GNAT family N-acetyltransferase n=1 Tax=Thermomonas sp. HDW16 TaxID=2714945 RepID=UPI0014085CAB|nr:GNAT family N-acetyltransferase [Thermomonas sp. HDW16]QIL21152.1 GNAT family N-acetyltransferase [Thermomonas sp. HDW16]